MAPKKPAPKTATSLKVTSPITAPAESVPGAVVLAGAAAGAPALVAFGTFPGAAWCLSYPTSTSIDDLVPEFAAKVHAMVASLLAGGAQVHISATVRPEPRAYLMHWACMIALGGQDPAEVPAMPGVLIDWTAGGNNKLAKALCAEMVKGYGIVFPAALVSRHTQGRAVDMTITMAPRPAALYKFTGGDGKVWMIGADDKAELYKFASTFGVIKLQSDPPHYSDDGH